MRADGEIHRLQPSGKTTSEGTYQCCHCARHCTIKVGSKRMRGFCRNCCHFTCGKPGCDACVHWQQKHDNLAGGLEINHRPVIVQSVDVRGVVTR